MPRTVRRREARLPGRAAVRRGVPPPREPSSCSARGCEPVDPMRRDFRGRTEGNETEIVEGDLEEIASCDAVLAAFTAPDEGTAMEAWYAHSLGKHGGRLHGRHAAASLDGVRRRRGARRARGRRRLGRPLAHVGAKCRRRTCSFRATGRTCRGGESLGRARRTRYTSPARARVLSRRSASATGV